MRVEGEIVFILIFFSSFKERKRRANLNFFGAFSQENLLPQSAMVCRIDICIMREYVLRSRGEEEMQVN